MPASGACEQQIAELETELATVRQARLDAEAVARTLPAARRAVDLARRDAAAGVSPALLRARELQRAGVEKLEDVHANGARIADHLTALEATSLELDDAATAPVHAALDELTRLRRSERQQRLLRHVPATDVPEVR